MHRHWIGWLGLGLLIFGLVGASFTGLWVVGRQLDRGAPDRLQDERGPYGDDLDSPLRESPPESEATLGERIYFDGIGQDGRRIPRSGAGMMMRRLACADCHGEDGRGQRVRTMAGALRSPDIRYDTLTGEHEDGEQGWSDEDIRKAVENGVEPDGQELDWVMPRWRLTGAEFDALLGQLKELSDR